MPSKKPRAKSTPVITPIPTKPQPTDSVAGDGDFKMLRRLMQETFAAIPVTEPLFLVESADLFDVFLGALPANLRQHYTCRTCRHFVNRFGGLVTVQLDGSLRSAIWPSLDKQHPALGPFVASIIAVQNAATERPVNQALVTADITLGTPMANGWDHFAIQLQKQRVHVSPLKSVDAQRAEYQQEQDMLMCGLAEFGTTQIQRAIDMLKSGALQRPEKGLPMAEWVLAQSRRVSQIHSLRAANLLWLISRTAPAGFNHIRSGMLGTLLDDIAKDTPQAQTVARWNALTDPSQYMRTQTAPAAGNLRRAETIIQQMEAAGSLQRRYCVRADVTETLWSAKKTSTTKCPECTDGRWYDVSHGATRRCLDCAGTGIVQTQSSGPVFGHIQPKQKATSQPQTYDVPAQMMTWEKFARTLLADASSIELHVPQKAQLAALVTAVNPESPPILQWNNPVSVYAAQAQTASWNLRPGDWASVDFITSMPYHWSGNAAPNQKPGVLLALQDCRDVNRTSGGGFLPEFLRSEYREIRASLDAYARQAVVAGRDIAEACGLALMKTSDVAQRSATTTTVAQIILVFDESGSMSGHLYQVNQQAETIRQQLLRTMPDAQVQVIRFGSIVQTSRSVPVRTMPMIRVGSDLGSTALNDTLLYATQQAVASPVPALIYLFTDGAENASRNNVYAVSEAVSSAMATGRVSYGCVGPRSATSTFSQMGIPLGAIRTWDGQRADLDAVTQQVAQGIQSYADAIASGRTAIDDFFSAPISGFGDGVMLRITLRSGARQVVTLDRWD
jgi:hypothetical protein